VRELHGASREHAPRHVVRREHACSVLRIGKRQVDEDGLEHPKLPNDKNAEGDERDDPVNVVPCRPCKLEQPRGHNNHPQKSGKKKMLRRLQAVTHDVRDQEVPLIYDECCNSDHGGRADGEEGKAGFAQIEAVHLGVDEREGLEEGVVDGVGVGCPSGRVSILRIDRHFRRVRRT
jgi:hypothetical protein